MPKFLLSFLFVFFFFVDRREMQEIVNGGSQSWALFLGPYSVAVRSRVIFLLFFYLLYGSPFHEYFDPLIIYY